ncbi:ladderlectin-like [Clupea harengus]|uniref:Ladderlectin-like n=1 Tax=Clupea harengus TaxID=7950 RepID=A0A6P8FVC0_CLUHA|nr:ladderlectin-like [Clupea harengus]XP_031427113.1 ladderlectin-like [Clupea harengus]
MKVLILAALLCMHSAVTHAATRAAPVSNSTASSMVEGPLPAVETGLPVYPSQCPSGWFTQGSRCFLMVTSMKNWRDAARHCVGQQGSLASVQSSEEYNFLQTMVTISGHSSAWIGGFYFQGAWLWIDSAGFYYTNWQTLNSVSSPCLQLNSNGGWSNQNCWYSRVFYCARSLPSC